MKTIRVKASMIKCSAVLKVAEYIKISEIKEINTIGVKDTNLVKAVIDDMT